MNHPKLEPGTTLRYAILGLNDIMGPEGSESSLLVLRSTPTFQTQSKDVSCQSERMRAVRTVREEVQNIRAEQKIKSGNQAYHSSSDT